MVSLFHKRRSSIFLLYFLVILSTTNTYTISAHNLGKQKASNSSVQAIFVFGDSTVDPGNNNHFKTVFKSNFLPYGVDFPNHTPTGRFCNGRLATDLIASYAGIKQNIPPYLDPNLSMEDLMTGVSFASAGSGYDPLTAAKTSVIDMPKQLQYFDEYKARIKRVIGKKGLEELMKRSIFAISSGSNDIIFTYGVVDSPPLQFYTAPTYLHFLLDQGKSFIQGLRDRGAEKIAVVGLPPVGCLPAVVTITPPYKPRKCVESLSALAREFNQMMQNLLKTMQASQPHSKFIYADIYTPLQDLINNPNKYGLEEVNKGCCGTGLLEASIICNSLTNVCSDRSKYVFWDAIHPTERSYSLLFDALRPLVDFVLRED